MFARSQTTDGQTTAAATAADVTVNPTIELYDQIIATAVDSDATTTQVPTGCACVETGAPNSSCTKFDCPCICDLTAGRCDPNCCCDAECSSAHTNYSLSTDSCLDDGTEADSINMCYDSSELFTVNAKFRMEKSVVGELLCVAIDNNPAVGTYFATDDSVADDVDSTNVDGFKKSGVEYPDRSDAQYLLVGDAVSVLSNSTVGGNFETGFSGLLTTPTAGIDGQCTEVGGRVGFMQDTSVTCTRQVVDSSGMCAVDSYVGWVDGGANVLVCLVGFLSRVVRAC